MKIGKIDRIVLIQNNQSRHSITCKSATEAEQLEWRLKKDPVFTDQMLRILAA